VEAKAHHHHRTRKTRIANATAQSQRRTQLKVIYCERLEGLLRLRNEHIDELTAKLQCARSANHQLEMENKHLAALAATPQTPMLT
jgi:hypothetical protein